MPARRTTTRGQRASDSRADTKDREAYEEPDAEDEEAYEEPDEEDRDAYAEDGRGREAYPDDDADERESHRRRPAPGGQKRMPAARAAEAGLRGLVDLIGKKPEGVTSVEPTEDGWLIGVEVIEDQRVPSSADILAVYEAELDQDGDLLSYRRTSRYSRGRGDQSRES